ncbi:hypothetical protein O0L34_g13952 [Tuta absoluta]|nr:hypothetical protein O0L34_g13952 [Tuta absoluta]
MDQANNHFSKSEMSLDTKLASLPPLVSKRASEHNVYMTYVCLVKDGLSRHLYQPTGTNGQATDVEEDTNDHPEPIQVEKSKAVHELVESIKNTDHNIIQGQPQNIIVEEVETSEQDEGNSYDDPKKLKLTKMKWLSENQSGYLDSSSPSVSSIKSTSSKESDNNGKKEPDIGEKCLSTILRLDKEHNLFGLSSIAIVDTNKGKPKQKNKDDDEKPVFHQTAIVQVCRPSCAGTVCCQPGCRNKSNTDLPCSLRYSSCCGSCCGAVPCRKPSCIRRPSSPLPKRPSCLSSCEPCLVAPPLCALIPRTPKIHATCLPDTPMLPMRHLTKPHCRECSKQKVNVIKVPCPATGRDPCPVTEKGPCPTTGRCPATEKGHCLTTGRGPCPVTEKGPCPTTGRCPATEKGHCLTTGRGPCLATEKGPCQTTGRDSSPTTGRGPCPATGRAPCPYSPPRSPCRGSDAESLPPCRAKSPTCICGLTAFVPPEPPQCCYGLKLKLNRKPDHKPAPHEITPRCTSELQKPLMARECTHTPCCRPPSSTFPYLMPCYWPCRPSAPCLDPTQCFHHPPCLPPSRPKGFVPISQECPKPGPCKSRPQGCKNKSCLGNNLKFQQGLAIWDDLCKRDQESPSSSPPLAPATKQETFSAVQTPIMKPEENPAPSHPPPPTSQQTQ